MFRLTRITLGSQREGLTTWQTKTMPRIKALEPMTTEERKPILL